MSATTPLAELIQAVSEGLARPRHAWAAAVIAVSLALGWGGARLLGVWLARRMARLPRLAAPAADSTASAGRRGGNGARRPRMRAWSAAGSVLVLRRISSPLIALACVWIGENLLRWRHVIGGPSDARLLRLAMFLLGAVVAVRVLFALLRRAFGRGESTLLVERLIAFAGVAGVVLYATGAWDDVLAWLVATSFPLGTNARVSLWSLLVGGITTLVSLLAAMWLGSLLDARIEAQTGLEPNLRTVLARVTRALLLIIALLLALALSGIDLTVLSVFGGALGVGLGLGLQRIASNYVSGFILLLDHSLRIGDMVTVDKYYGEVTQISTRYTVLRAGDGTEAIVPNEMLVASPVVNLTLADRRLNLPVQVGVGPDTDLPRACQLLSESARKVPRVMQDPAPITILKEIKGGNFTLEIDFWISDPENGRGNVQSNVMIAAVDCLRANGIQLAVPLGEYKLAGQPNAPKP